MTSVICPVEFITFFIMILIDEDIMIIIIVLHLFFPDIVSKQVVGCLQIYLDTIYIVSRFIVSEQVVFWRQF